MDHIAELLDEIERGIEQIRDETDHLAKDRADNIKHAILNLTDVVHYIRGELKQ